MADSAPDAAPLPVTMARLAWLLLVTCLAPGAGLVAQRPVLPYGLKAGRHDVGILRLRLPDGALIAWYPARCARRAPAPVAPCVDAPAEPGPFPLVLLAVREGVVVHDDTVLATYLVSHGYVVAVPTGGAAGTTSRFSLDGALESLRALDNVDSLRIAVAARGAGVAMARDSAGRSARVGAMIEVDPPDRGVESAGSPARRPPTLVVLSASARVTPSPAPDRVAIRTPRCAERQRLVLAVTHLFLSAVLRGWGDSLPALATRLRELGL